MSHKVDGECPCTGNCGPGPEAGLSFSEAMALDPSEVEVCLNKKFTNRWRLEEGGVRTWRTV